MKYDQAENFNLRTAAIGLYLAISRFRGTD